VNAPSAIPAANYDARLIGQLIREEIADFWKHIDDETLTRDQELRGALLAWFCYFAPELVSEDARTLLFAVQKRIRSMQDFQYRGWFRILPIEMALYGLTRESHWLDRHKQEFSCGGSALRFYVMECLALAAPELSIDDDVLHWRVRRNFEVRHTCCEWGGLLFLAGRGEKDRKQALAREWSATYRLNDSEHQVLDALARFGMVENPFFAGHFSKIQSYIIERLCMRRSCHLDIQENSVLFAGSIAAQVERHPLMDSYFQIADS